MKTTKKATTGLMPVKKTLGSRIASDLRNNWQLHLMILPGIILVLIFKYAPLAGITIAFKDFYPARGIFGSDWVGLENFQYMFDLPDTARVLWNTLKIAVLKIIINFPIPIIVAILLNEVRSNFFKRSVQTIVYLPYFISWVILAGIILDIFSLEGIVNKTLNAMGLSSVFFLGDNSKFVGLLVGTDVWKNFGYGTVVYLAAITGVDESLFEAARIDGANRFKQILHVTIPSIAPIIMLMMILNLGNVLNAGFEQVFNLYNPLVYESADIIDTFVYRISLVEANYSLGTAVGLLKSVVSFILIVSSYALANKYSDYTIF
ncbi:ABC transporter permease [Lachnotalea sp. AF33-28]|uniref:ABC transporter permease n=1 Tax=Lachnotalea sp. AF33-28 TaxID=2292046 RepID=UPI000E520719|nr:sugar ABC transporter permease [Lachnotalea sp. AF33-28]